MCTKPTAKLASRARARRPPAGSKPLRKRVWRDEEEREIHENAANLPLRECFSPKKFRGLRPSTPPSANPNRRA